MIQLNLINRVKHFFGLFNLTPFEQDLIDALKKNVDQETRAIIEDQMSRFNRVQRILADDPRIKNGSTMFYWGRSGKSFINEFPKRISRLEKVEESTFFRCVAVDSQGNEITVLYRAVCGVFVLLEYWSQKRVWYPKGSYALKETENLLPAA